MTKVNQGRHRCFTVDDSKEPVNAFNAKAVEPHEISGRDVGAESWNGPHKTGYEIKSGDDDAPSTLVIHGKHEFVHDDDGTHLVSHDGTKIATFHDCHAERDDDGTLHIHHGARDRHNTHDGSTSQHHDVARIRSASQRFADFWKRNKWDPAGTNQPTPGNSTQIKTVADLQRRLTEYWSK